jgi:hypothetical protein
VFVDRRMAVRLRPVLSKLVKKCVDSIKTRHWSSVSIRACGRDVPHDLHLGTVLRMNNLSLVHGTFLLSQPPSHYLIRKTNACSPRMWLYTPPAVTHYALPNELLYLAKLASVAANTTWKKGQVAVSFPLSGSPPHDQTARTSFLWRPVLIKMVQNFFRKAVNGLCSSPSSSCSTFDCALSAPCTAQLLVSSWSRLETRSDVPILNPATLPGSNLKRIKVSEVADDFNTTRHS